EGVHGTAPADEWTCAPATHPEPASRIPEHSEHGVTVAAAHCHGVEREPTEQEPSRVRARHHRAGRGALEKRVEPGPHLSEIRDADPRLVPLAQYRTFHRVDRNGHPQLTGPAVEGAIEGALAGEGRRRGRARWVLDGLEPEDGDDLHG